MRHNSAIFITIIFIAGFLCVIGCHSTRVRHLNSEYAFTDAQVADYTASALAGDGDAAWRLCLYYKLIKFDGASGLKWMKIAAEAGNLSGQYNLAHEYEGAFDKSMLDLKKARYWYQRAADAGDDDSKRKLSELHDK